MQTHLISAASLILSLLAVAAAQEPATSPAPKRQEEVVRVTTNLVQADVVVTDKAGQHVTDLQAGDFEILEDGKRQAITNFSYIVADSSAGSKADAGNSQPAMNASGPVVSTGLSREKVSRTMAIVVDDLGLSAESTASVRTALRKFVNEQMQPNDLVAIIRTSRGIGALQQFTSDKRRLMASIDRLNWFPAGRGGVSPFAPMDTQQQETATQGAQIINEMEEERAAKYAVGTISTLGFVMRGLTELPGRKAVLLIAESFRLFTTQGRNVRLIDSLKQVTDQANLASIVIYTLDASGLNPLNLTAEDRVSGPGYTFDPNAFSAGGPASTPTRNRSTPRRNDVAPTAASIAQDEGGSSAAFRKLDALIAQRDSQNMQNQSVLSYIAERTGGLFTANTNDLSLGTNRMLQDQRGYYLLAYRPEESNVDPATGRRRYHNLTVKVKRSGLKVRSRAGYYGIANEIAAVKNTSAQQLAAALISPFSSGAIGLRVTPLFFNDPTGGSYVRALLHLDAHDLTFTEQPDKSLKTVLDVAAVNFGADGSVVDSFTDSQALEINANMYQSILQNGLNFVLNVPTKQAGVYQLRVAVRDVSSERIGSAGQFIEVPNLNKNTLSLSGILINGLTQTAARSAPVPTVVKQEPGNGNQLSASADDAVIQAGPAVRRLRHGMILSYGYTIYNAQVKGTNVPQLQTQTLLFRDGKQVFAGNVANYDPGKQTDMKRLKVKGGLRIGPELIPGEYVLQVVVSDNLKDKRNTATQSLDFEIVD